MLLLISRGQVILNEQGSVRDTLLVLRGQCTPNCNKVVVEK